MFKQTAKLLSALTAAVVLAAVVVLMLPPWWGKWPYLVHVRTGIPYAFGWPPSHFTGVWREYRLDGKLEELSYKRGKRHGPQLFYDATGKVMRVCEFRDGEPWSGLCDFWKWKPWLADYREGKVWKGAMQEYDDTKQDYVMRYYFEGKLYGEPEFRHLMGFGKDGSLIGVMCVKSRPR